MDFKDYYATLGVPKTATPKELKQAYRKLARKHHPDVNPGDKSAESKFKELNEAYEVLGDPDKRKKYDELGSNWRMYEQAGAAGGLYLRSHVAPHPTFERKERDLYTHVPVPLTTAVLGGEADVKTLGGKPLRLKIPPTTQNGQVFRLKGHGMPATGKAGTAGD